MTGDAMGGKVGFTTTYVRRFMRPVERRVPLSGQLLATAAFISRRRELINRLFSIPDVGRAKVEQRLGAITLWLLKGGFQRSELLEASAAAMRLAEAARHSFPNQPPGQPDLHVFRSGR